jgi:hypothetical protein
MPFTTQPLDASTWDAFAELAERNNGIFGGCWYIGFHPERAEARGAGPFPVQLDRRPSSSADSPASGRLASTPGS